ncbi:hypothetical protein PIB30_080994 [Stylosanthes scabra]|uniref:Peroxidase n=1 Tax=Stylosanthes scabra TaxID=79078 RepID=A0ABU6WRG6_9FABA|nr:hypothetical protein [Stylosanthes scabra]
MSPKKLNSMVIVFAIYLLSQHVHSELEVGYYSDSCGMAEFIVKDEVRKAYNRDPGLAAGLVRMHFHDCFIRGCDGSVLLDSTPSNTAEKDSPANNPSLRGFDVIDSVGGVGYDVPAGRRDGRISLISDTRTDLPPPTFNVNQLTQLFAKKGLTKEEMVTLSGAHTIGRSHCVAFNSRLYNFSTSSLQDPSMDPSYALFLKRRCPQGNTNQNIVVPMDPTSPGVADVGYYNGILANRGLFISDQTLLTDTETASQVYQYSRDRYTWASKFADAMVKMGQIGVLTGNDGEIRENCRVVNS